MIKPNELRIGNLVFCNTADQVVKVQWPHPAELVVEIKTPFFHSPHTHCDLEEIDPILLTSEWLERLGFEHAEESPGDGWYEIHIVRHFLQVCPNTSCHMINIVDEHDICIIS